MLLSIIDNTIMKNTIGEFPEKEICIPPSFQQSINRNLHAISSEQLFRLRITAIYNQSLNTRFTRAEKHMSVGYPGNRRRC